MAITGNGTQIDPYVLYEPSDFEWLKSRLTSYFRLNNDVDFNGIQFIPPLDFAGDFDGNGKVVKNLAVSNGNYSSLFGRTTAAFVVKNLGLDNPQISGGLYTGALVGHNVGGTIENCFTVGGYVTGSAQIGALVGFTQGGTIRNCFSNTHITATGTSRIGGLVGRSSGAIINSYNAGLVTANFANAGLNGEGTNVTSSYWDTQTSGKTASAGGIGKTTAQMKTQATYTGWDFTDVWGINPTKNSGYPYLLAFETQSTSPPICTIVSLSKSKISDESGMNQSLLTFKFDQAVTEWRVRTIGVDPDTGILADSGGAVAANTEIIARIEWNELYQEGSNRINIYGRNADGQWTVYGS